jgi:peroxiredoxin
MTIARIGLVGIALSLASPAFAEIKKGDRAADFEKKTASGQTFKLSSLRGKVVLLDFWASWCEPCKKELPVLGKLAPKLKAKGIEIVTVNIDDKKENADDFIRSHKLEQLTVVSDNDKSVIGKYEPPKMPSSFVVDQAGVVRAVNAGFSDGDEAKIEQQLDSFAKK